MVFASVFRGKTHRDRDLIVIIEHVPTDQNIDGKSYAGIGSDHNGTLLKIPNLLIKLKSQVKEKVKSQTKKRIQRQTIGFQIQIATQNASKKVRYRDLGSDFFIIEHILYRSNAYHESDAIICIDLNSIVIIIFYKIIYLSNSSLINKSHGFGTHVKYPLRPSVRTWALIPYVTSRA